MPNVTIVSPFRDCPSDSLIRYITQVSTLDHPADNLRFIAAEGDSADDTHERLILWAKRDSRVTVIKNDTNEPHYPSIVSIDRFKHLAKVFNVGLDAVDTDWSTHVLFLPSDVIYDPDMLSRLLARDKDCIAPMFWHATNTGLLFYDVWGFQRDFNRFRPYSPQWYLKTYGDEPIEMTYIGGAKLSKIDVIKAGVRYQPGNVDHGFCERAWDAGFSVWADPTAHIVHEAKNGA